MTSGGIPGLYGGYNYQSPTMRALGSITPESYDYRDQSKMMSKLVGDVSFMGGMMRKMQKGIDDANQNFIQQLQSLINDFLVLFGGGGDTGLDFGDLKYPIQALGALFGFGDGVLPINLFNAAWHFFSNYILGGENFTEVINTLIDNAIASILDIFGEVPIIGQALQQLAVIISNIRDALAPLLTALDALFAAFGGDASTGDLGSFGTLWDTLMGLFGTITAPVAAALAPLWPVLAQITQPFIDILTQIIEFVTNFIDLITGGVNDLDDFIGGTYNPINILLNIVTNLLANGLGGSMDWPGLVLGLFGLGGGTQTMFGQLGSNLMSFLGGGDFTSGGFNLLTQAQTFLNTILSPAGALSTSTPIPGHLFGNLKPGTSSVNLFPDPSFDDATVLDGLGLWNWSSTGRTRAGSAHTTAGGTLKQLIGVPVPTDPGEVTNLEGWLKWTTLTATAGQAIKLKAISYDANDIVITDPTTILASITTPGSASASYGGNVSGWVKISGTHQAPAGTAYVRFCLEIDLVVTGGDIYLDDCVHQLQNGIVDASILTNIENIPQLIADSVAGYLGIPDLGTNWQHILDGLGSAYHPSSSVSGIDYSDLFSLAQAGTVNAITAAFQAALHTVILGNRTNKPAVMGANPTSVTSMTAGHFSSAGSLTTTSLTAGNSMAQRFTVPEYATFGFIENMLAGTGVTNIFVNIYKVDPVSNVKTALFNSSNIAATIPSSVGHVRTLLPGMPQVLASDELFMEIVNNGSNALTVVSKATGVPNNTNEVIQNTGWTRTVAAGGASPTSLTSGQGTYSGTVPYAVLGIINVPDDYHPAAKDDYTSAGSYNEVMPSWLTAGDAIDIIGIGGGGGGGSSFFYVPGGDGKSSDWYTFRLIVGTDIVLGSTYYWTVGGRGSSGGSSSSGGTGGTTSFTYTHPTLGTQTVNILGGAGGAYGGAGGGGTGVSPQNITVDDITYFGAASVGAGNTGQSPGGGGGGAISYLNGTSGGVGQLSLYKVQL